jgi:aspartate 1-decarboxylase
MLREVLRSKISNATVTGKELYYQGSIGIDKEILSKSSILVNEKVQVLNVNNGEYFYTYVIEEESNGGAIILYGPAARKAEIGDKICIISYGLEEDSRSRTLNPKEVLLDERNKIKL